MSDIILKEEDKFNIYQGFLYSLHSLCNREKQERSWIKGDYSSYVSFEEVYMCFMSPCKYILTWPELSEEQHQNLKKLYNMLENYDEYYPARKKTDKEICNDPKWHKVRNYAQIVYEDLKSVKFVKISDG